MTILFMILKIAGLILAILLGLLLLMILVVTLVPVRYKGHAVFQKEQSPDLVITASYLLHLFTVKVSYSNRQTDGTVRILFLKKKLFRADAEEEEKEEESSTGKDKKKPSSKKQKKAGFSGFLMAIPAMLEELQKEENKQAFALCIEQLKYLCRHFGPRKLTGNLRFSLSDPAYTGIALGGISLFPIIYKQDFQIRPDFESDQIYAEGKIVFSGRIRILHAMICFIKLLKNKTIRRLFIKGGSSNVRK